MSLLRTFNILIRVESTGLVFTLYQALELPSFHKEAEQSSQVPLAQNHKAHKWQTGNCTSTFKPQATHVTATMCWTGFSKPYAG